MILLAITSLLLACLPLVVAQCYDQSGAVAAGTPCNTGSFPTFCCPSGYACLSNGLCGKGNALQMGTCSDKSWSGGSCAKYCPVGYSNMAMCISESGGKYCCETTTGTTCCSGRSQFHLRDVTKVSTVPFTTLTSSTSKKTGTSASAKSTSKASQTSSDSSSTSSSTSSLTLSSISSSRSSSSRLATSSGNSIDTATQTPTAVSTLAPPTSIATKPPVGGMTTGAKIGTVVGAVCGFAFAGFIVYFITFLLRRRHHDKINAERARQIQAKTGRTFSSNINGGHDRGGATRGTAQADFPRTSSPMSRETTAPQYFPMNNQNRQHDEILPPVPQRVHSLSSQTGYHHLANDEPFDPAYMSRPTARTPSNGSLSPQEQYRPYRTPTLSNAHELGNIDPVAAVQYNQLPSHYSISGSAMTYPTQVPQRGTPAQELAAARLRSNISPMGLVGIDG